MADESPTNWRSGEFWPPLIIALVLAVAASLAYIVYQGGLKTPYKPAFSTTASPADVKQLIAYINGPPRPAGHIQNFQVQAAKRLGGIGPMAKQFGADQALATLIATTNDPEAKSAAEIALAQIEGR
ncbi:MAG TPA: hypothetical protein VGN12_20790 [Pirellulales bacterium]|jgi:hypothetical protein